MSLYSALLSPTTRRTNLRFRRLKATSRISNTCLTKRIARTNFDYIGRNPTIVGRERRERVSQLTWCGEGCFDSRGRVNFYEAGSGQEVIRVDWFTLLFKVTRVSQGCGVFFRGLSQRCDEAHSQPRGLPSS